MKKITKKISIFLTMMLILMSFEVICVFANEIPADGTSSEVEQQRETANPSTNDSALLRGSEDLTEDASDEGVAPTAPEVRALASFYSTWLEWKEVDNPNPSESDFAGKVKYSVERRYSTNGGAWTAWTPWHGSVETTSFHDTGLDQFTAYQYRVQSYIEGTDLYSEPVTTNVVSPVRTMRYVLTVKKSGTLKSHRGPKQSLKVTKGEVIYADRFMTGKYIFDYNGSTFYIARTRVGKKVAEYQPVLQYTREEAQHFIQDSGIGSSTGVIIWVNTFTQHVYYFIHDGNNWICPPGYDWECSTGTASTPTPTSLDGVKTIKKKIKRKNGIKWWSTFHGNAALHGRKNGKQVGAPASNGCVRNPDEYAGQIYTYAPKGTRVYIH